MLLRRAAFYKPPSSGGGLGAELVINGTFDSPAGWTFPNGTGTISGGVASFDGSNIDNVSRLDPVEPITAGNYKWEFDLVATDGAAPLGVIVGGTQQGVPGSTVPGHYSGTITTAAANQAMVLRTTSETACTVDNFSIKRVL